MTEQEIVDYLKKNKSEGRIISFMPEEVKRWCEEHIKELLVWQSHRWYKFDADDICTDDAVTLPDDYKVNEESKGGWVEFDINKNGDFEISGSRNDRNITVIYNWSQWNKPIRDNASENFINGCCAFGGWQYEGSTQWFTSPQIRITNCDSYLTNGYFSTDKSEPVIPIKIRFWKGE